MPIWARLFPGMGGATIPLKRDTIKYDAPVMAFYGGQDQSIPMEQVQKIESMFKAAGKNITVNVYPDAGHAFINPDHGMGNDEAAADAWPKAVNFLKENLK